MGLTAAAAAATGWNYRCRRISESIKSDQIGSDRASVGASHQRGDVPAGDGAFPGPIRPPLEPRRNRLVSLAQFHGRPGGGGGRGRCN